MSLQCGIVGLPNVGKSTLFNALSNAKAQSANFPFCTIEPNVGTITVPDDRLVELEKLVNPQQVVPTTIEIVDIAGLVKGASKGEGLGNQFLSNIRNTDAIIHVLRCFEDDNITHVDGDVDPIRDKETIDLELIFKDLDSIEKRIDKFKKVAKSGDKEALKSVDFLNNLKAYLEEGKAARGFDMEKEEFALIADLNLLTMKPVLYVCNVDENSVVEGNAHTKKVEEIVKEENAEMLLISAAMEADIAGLDSFEDRQMFLEEMGLDAPGVHRLIQSSYKLLNLITYFTAGEKELRAWTVNKGSTAPQAAGVIHTDFEKGFIRAEVIPYNAYIEHGSEAAVKEAGKMNVEGKEYIVQDGDVMHFRHNV